MLFIASYIKCWASIMWFLKHDSLLHYIAFNSHLCESSISHTESYRWWCPLEINSIHKSKHSTVVTINLSFGLFIGFTKDSFFVFDKIWANCNYWSLVLCLYIFWRCKKEHMWPDLWKQDIITYFRIPVYRIFIIYIVECIYW